MKTSLHHLSLSEVWPVLWITRFYKVPDSLQFPSESEGTWGTRTLKVFLRKHTVENSMSRRPKASRGCQPHGGCFMVLSPTMIIMWSETSWDAPQMMRTVFLLHGAFREGPNKQSWSIEWSPRLTFCLSATGSAAGVNTVKMASRKPWSIFTAISWTKAMKYLKYTESVSSRVHPHRGSGWHSAAPDVEDQWVILHLAESTSPSNIKA